VAANYKLKSLKEHFYRYPLMIRLKVRAITIDVYELYISKLAIIQTY